MNDEIHAETVRLISEDSDQLGILPIQEARQIALDRDLDLVEISPNANPPVCRVMDYGKFLYATSKKKQEGKKKQKQGKSQTEAVSPNRKHRLVELTG